MKKIIAFGLLLIVSFSSCVGSPIHSTFTYCSVKKTIANNNAALMKLKIGMTQEQVWKVIGRPERSEGYPWGSAWLYRTAMTSGIYGTADPDFTPVMFNKNTILHGWGRNYFEQYVSKYELTIKQQN